MVNWAIVFTLSRIVFTPVFVAVLFMPIPNREWLAAVVFCIAAATDAMDGFIARRTNSVTKLGTLLDPVADKLLVVTALIFLIGRGVPAWIAWVLIAREFVVVSLRLLAPKTTISPSMFGKSKTLAEMVGIVAVLLKIWFAWWILFAAVILSVISAIQYFWRAREAIKI